MAQTRKPSLRTVDNATLQRDLLSFREKALELGASAAEIIQASSVVVQERVWLKCLVPRCAIAGSTHCPPNTPQPDFMRKVFSQYQWAVLFKRDIDSKETHFKLSEDGPREVGQGSQKRPLVHRKTWEILGRLESYVQSRGYDLAMGFSAGSCRGNLCAMAPCAVTKGESCRHPLQARPSMEAIGIDVFDIASKVGWDSYMIRNAEPNLDEIPCALSVGIVFIY